MTLFGGRPRWATIAVAVVAVVGGVYAFATSTTLPEALQGDYYFDLWFQGDMPRVVPNLTDPFSDFYRNSVHPIVAPLFLPTGWILTKLGVSAWDASRFITAIGAAIMTGLFLVVARAIAGRWLDAGLAVLALLGSSAFLFWAGTPEIYVWGGASILAVLAVLASAKGGEPNPVAFVAASAASLGFTITNWCAGLIAAVLAHPWRRAIVLSLLAFGVVAVLAVLSVNMVATEHPFLYLREEKRYLHAGLGDFARAVPAFLISSIVAPPPTAAPLYRPDWVEYMVSFQRTDWRAIGLVGAAATVAWIVCLGLGVATLAARLFKSRFADRLALTLTLVLAAQFGLHFLYGEETFLYAMHFAPLLILAALYGATSRWRPVALTLLATTALLGGAVNWMRHDEALTLVRGVVDGNERANAHNARMARPDDLWPSAGGHVPLGVGLAEKAKAYVEPGGAFSPSAGSFGVSVWVRDGRGEILRTSATTPLDLTSSRFLPDGSGLESETPDYIVRWTQFGAGRWTMTLSPEKAVSVAIRSAGPSGGPITSIRRDGEAIVVSDRWRIEAQNMNLEAMGVEAEGWPWADHGAVPQAVEDAEGWCFALLRLRAGAQTASLTITDLAPGAGGSVQSPLANEEVVSGLTLNLPDPRFQASLDAQVAQILHGVVGDQLRPGDPMNYPLAWQRDAAAEIVALVRAGRADAARVLVQHVAEVDYFGGFGAETDAPGLALWAIGETSRALDDPAFDAAMAEHVQRKADEILAFMQTSGEMERDYAGPLAPVAVGRDVRLVARPSKDGLIHGRMDWHDPALSLTAISLHGLEEAARLAERRDDTENAERWADAARKLRAAWRNNAAGEDLSNERTLALGLSPSFVAAGLPGFKDALEGAWDKIRDERGGFRERPLWTYFDIAQARQWLVLGRPDRAWATVDYFWNEALHPGLYTMWESNHEEGGFRLWREMRAWNPTAPAQVTPHYWASAEMILLQTAMLAYADRTPGREALVIGEGVRSDWPAEPMEAQGLVTEWGRVDWRWDPAGVMHVRAPRGVAVRLGPSFPAGAKIEVGPPPP